MMIGGICSDLWTQCVFLANQAIKGNPLFICFIVSVINRSIKVLKKYYLKLLKWKYSQDSNLLLNNQRCGMINIFHISKHSKQITE